VSESSYKKYGDMEKNQIQGKCNSTKTLISKDLERASTLFFTALALT
jgi:hypothetical protein